MVAVPLSRRSVGSGNYEIARGLAPLENRNYTIVLTEAGVIPYFSRWRTIDAWGLNDAMIVHDPRGLTAEYLAQNNPAVIMFFLAPDTVNSPADFGKVWRGDPPGKQDITQLMPVMGHYAKTHKYRLIARWGITPCRVHVWYVRQDLPEFEEVAALIGKAPHFFSYGNQLATNYLEDNPPQHCEQSPVSIQMDQ